MKNSKFKFYLINNADLINEVSTITPYLNHLPTEIESWSPQHVCYFLLIYFNQRGKKNWWTKNSKKSSLNPKTIIESSNFEAAFIWFKQNQIKNIPKALHLSIQNWVEQCWPLKIVNHDINPVQMMQLQAQGERVICIDLDSAKNGRLVDEKRDAFEFVLHDLMHAYHFFCDNQNYQEQVNFFKTMCQDYFDGPLKTMTEQNAEFRKNIEYVMSDMNTNIHHLKATYDAHLRLFKQNI